MKVTATYRVLDEEVEIVLRRLDGNFSSSSWSAQRLYGEWNGHYVESDCTGASFKGLFEEEEWSGNGVLVDSRTLEIRIPYPPKIFELSTNGFTREYYTGFDPLLPKIPSALVSVPGGIHYPGSPNRGYDYPGMGVMVLLRNDDSWGVNRSVLGKVYDSGGTLVGFATGVGFENIVSVFTYSMGGNCSNISNRKRYSKGGYIFSQLMSLDGNTIAGGEYALGVDAGSGVVYKSFTYSGGSNGVLTTSHPSNYNIDWENVDFFQSGETDKDMWWISSMEYLSLFPLSSSRWGV